MVGENEKSLLRRRGKWETLFEQQEKMGGAYCITTQKKQKKSVENLFLIDVLWVELDQWW